MVIVGDDKDWTWVLDKPCPECGFDAAEVSFSQLPGLLRDQVQRWSTLMHTRMNLALRRDDQTWSRLEYAAHVRDVCRIMLARLNLMLVLEEPEFDNWDQDATAVAAGYGTLNPADLAIEIAAAGESLARAVELVPESAVGRRGRRSNGSIFTVESLSTYCLHDLVHHSHDVGIGH